jgi:hypothetical protein
LRADAGQFSSEMELIGHRSLDVREASVRLARGGVFEAAVGGNGRGQPLTQPTWPEEWAWPPGTGCPFHVLGLYPIRCRQPRPIRV